jgi:hypothetical protein
LCEKCPTFFCFKSRNLYIAFGEHQIGYCPPNFEKSMEAEHCTLPGCEQIFQTSNYTEIKTCPKKEWEIIMMGAPCPEHDMRFNRRIPVITELCELPLAKKALLQKAEVIAVVMYTGPMVCRHCVLMMHEPFEKQSF